MQIFPAAGKVWLKYMREHIRWDAEAIIRLATYGIVRLELVIPPVPVREKPYYL